MVIESLKADQWLLPQLATVKNHTITLVNNSKQPVFLTEKKATSVKITPATITDTRQITQAQPQLHATKPIEKFTDAETIGLIKVGKTDTKTKNLLDAAHSKHRRVFDKDLSGGYSGYFGHHVCKLNWTSLQRPEARKVPIANYDHSLVTLKSRQPTTTSEYYTS